MFAVIKIAGRQFKVQAGQSLFVPHLAGKTGDKVEFSDIMFLENDGNISMGTNAAATVTAEIIKDMIKGVKVIAFKMKRRKGFRKKHGHRTQYTQIKVTDIVTDNASHNVATDNVTDVATDNVTDVATDNVTDVATDNVTNVATDNVTDVAANNNRI
jgi:large subunit ribosomal protein L21